MSPAPARRPRAACLACAFVLGLLAAAANAQDDKEKVPKWRIDKYTRNEPEAIQKAGYVSFGPFEFGNLGANPVQSSHIDKFLHYAQILWVETKHFRIGINLPQMAVPQDAEVRAKLRAELERLQQKIPRVDPKTRVLDPWLRTHLFAQRAEDIYAEFCRLAGVKDEDFPQAANGSVITPGKRYMGQGPYLGMNNKYLLLLFEKEGTYKDYLKSYVGRDSKFGQRWHCKDVGSLLFAVSTDSDGGRLKDDTALHCHVAFNVSQNLVDGFRHYSYDLPVWIREGLGHWFERRVSPEWNSFDQNEGSPADMKTLWKWGPYCRNLVATGGKFAPFPEAYAWRDFGNITFNDHVAIWSRIDWLLSREPERWQKFLFAIKGRVDANWLPNQEDLVGAVRDALQEAYGVSPLDFDLKWGEWVKQAYPAQ